MIECISSVLWLWWCCCGSYVRSSLRLTYSKNTCASLYSVRSDWASLFYYHYCAVSEHLRLQEVVVCVVINLYFNLTFNLL